MDAESVNSGGRLRQSWVVPSLAGPQGAPAPCSPSRTAAPQGQTAGQAVNRFQKAIGSQNHGRPGPCHRRHADARADAADGNGPRQAPHARHNQKRSRFEGLKRSLAQIPLGHHAIYKGAKSHALDLIHPQAAFLPIFEPRFAPCGLAMNRPQR